MFVMDGCSVRVDCCVGDFSEGTAIVTNSFEGAAVAETSCGVGPQRTVERIRRIDVLICIILSILKE